MSRRDIERIEDRRPFYLYVDEFQNFATDSFATILSEARKYGLNLTVANQYISQMGETVRDAVFGNVGTMISFRVSADDAPILAKQFEPQFEATDLLQMHNRNFVINMVINGEKAPAFNARTLTLPHPQTDNTGRIIENTRRNYSRSRAEVESEISDAVRPVGSPKTTQTQQPATKTHDIKWPIGIKPIFDDENKSEQGTVSSPDTTETVSKPKRKRVRSRKKKDVSNNEQPKAEATTKDNTIKIKH
jgi:hypothetical protein